MVKKSVSSPAAVDDPKLLVSSISKKSNLHSLAKVLKPKVYILSDSSTFKNLVQELTGNGNIGCTSVSASTSPSSSCATTFKPIHHEQVAMIHNVVMYTGEDYSFQEISPEISLHSSDHRNGLISIPVTSDSPPCAIISEPLVQVPVTGNRMMYPFEDYGFQESSPELSFDSPDHYIDLISTLDTWDFSEEIMDYMPTTLISKDHEFQSTWDMMSFPIQNEEMDSSAYNNYGLQWLQPLVAQEVCAFDCDLSAIM